MTTPNLTPAQQTQMDNRDATGQWRAKTHAAAEDSADVLGIGRGSAPVHDALSIDEDLARRNFEDALKNRPTKHGPNLRTSASILAASSDSGRATVDGALAAERDTERLFHGPQKPQWSETGSVRAQHIEEGISQADTLEGNLIRWKGEGVGTNAVEMSPQEVADTVEDHSTYQRLDLSKHPSRQHEHHPDATGPMTFTATINDQRSQVTPGETHSLTMHPSGTTESTQTFYPESQHNYSQDEQGNIILTNKHTGIPAYALRRSNRGSTPDTLGA